jgi:TonB family protein
MPGKIEINAFHVLFRLFAYLADKSGGWRGFVSPKLLLGSLILIMSNKQVNAQNQKTETEKKDPTKSNSIKVNLKDSIQSIERDEHILCYLVLEKMPAFPGGDDKLVEYLSKKLIYPKEAVAKKIQGRVICKFMVNEDGSITNIEVIRSVDPLLDAEAIRVIKTLPKFIPGTQHDKPVGVYFTLPIIFSIPKNNHVTKN